MASFQRGVGCSFWEAKFLWLLMRIKHDWRPKVEDKTHRATGALRENAKDRTGNIDFV